jgi:pimeloyl-ACP methyl ester carboxylesterase
MRNRIPRCRWISVPGAGHAVHVEQPQAFAEEVLAFLQQWM